MPPGDERSGPRVLNSVVLIGRLTKDPDLRYTQSGKAVATIRLAVDRGTTNPSGEKEVDYCDVVVWDKQAETVSNYLQKGRLVAVQGRLQVRTYETQEGQKREKAEIVANTVRFLDKAGETAPTGAGAPPKGGGSLGQEIDLGTDDDVPF
jgi:single-strand DNA-binding protein